MPLSQHQHLGGHADSKDDERPIACVMVYGTDVVHHSTTLVAGGGMAPTSNHSLQDEV